MADITKRFFQMLILIFVVVFILIIIIVLLKNDSNLVNKPNPRFNPHKNISGKIVQFPEQKIRVWPKSLPKSPECGIDPGVDRIVGGKDLEFYEHPWTALLNIQFDNGLKMDCGGTLINHQYVITAAHCLNFKEAKLIEVLLGEQNMATEPFDCLLDDPTDCATDQPVIYSITKIIVHPGYNNTTKEHDIALVKLNASVIFNEIMKPICLPDTNFYTHKLGNGAFAIGWGLTDGSDNSSQHSIKQIVELTIWDRKECSQKFNKSGTQICAGGEEGKDACTYDSGGPLVRLAHISPPTWFLEGIVSHGFNKACGVKGYPGIYTNVSAHRNWILAVVTDEGRLNCINCN